jgi:hypothetical protein
VQLGAQLAAGDQEAVLLELDTKAGSPTDCEILFKVGFLEKARCVQAIC